jgi:hypothetical protein
MKPTAGYLFIAGARDDSAGDRRFEASDAPLA